jgi:hypothetical protein
VSAWELRHTFVSVMAESSVVVERISRLAGDSRCRPTEPIYQDELRPVTAICAAVMGKIFI